MDRRWLSFAAVIVVSAGAMAAACSGSQGPVGPPGGDGEAGAPGMTGATGTTGATGATGDAGALGPAGEAGAPGDAGPQAASLVISDTAKLGLDIAPVQLDLANLTSSQLELVGSGSYLVNAVADCSSCHGGGATYLGGACNAPDGGPPACSGGSFTVPAGGDAGLTTVYPRNLTPDPGTGLSLSLSQFIDTIRTGADLHDPGHQLVVMPWSAFRWLSTYDLQSIYAYLQVIPPVVNAVPADINNVSPPSTLPVEPTVYTAGDQDGGTPLPPESAPVPFSDASAPVPDPGYVLRGLALNPLAEVSTAGMDTATLTAFGRGSYLVNSAGDCSGCHTNRDLPSGNIATGAYLAGGVIFDLPAPLWSQGYVRSASADLIGATNGFFSRPDMQFSTFEKLVTEGLHAEDPAPERTVAWPMPWTNFKHMTLGDLEAIYTYMSTVAAQYKTHVPDKLIPDPARYCDQSTQCPMGSSCSSNNAPGECLSQSCSMATVKDDCAVCQTCSATTGGVCQTLSGGALQGCEGPGY